MASRAALLLLLQRCSLAELTALTMDVHAARQNLAATRLQVATRYRATSTSRARAAKAAVAVTLQAMLRGKLARRLCTKLRADDRDGRDQKKRRKAGRKALRMLLGRRFGGGFQALEACLTGGQAVGPLCVAISVIGSLAQLCKAELPAIDALCEQAQERLVGLQRIEALQAAAVLDREDAAAANPERADATELVPGSFARLCSQSCCPICLCGWETTEWAARLPCAHHVCLPCLCFQSEASLAEEVGSYDHGTEFAFCVPFSCALCRGRELRPLADDTVAHLAREALERVAEEGATTGGLSDDSFSAGLGQLATLADTTSDGRERSCSLLIKHRFDAAAAAEELWTEIQIACEPMSNHASLEQAFQEAERPLQRLREALESERQNLRALQAVEGEALSAVVLGAPPSGSLHGGLVARGRPSDACRQRIAELEKQLEGARRAAGDDVFAAVNVDTRALQLLPDQRHGASGGGASGESACLEVDFHGQRVSEALRIFDETVAPVMSVEGEIVLIVGRGAHAPSGQSALMPALEQHARRRGYRCEEVEGRPGTLRVIHSARFADDICDDDEEEAVVGPLSMPCWDDAVAADAGGLPLPPHLAPETTPDRYDRFLAGAHERIERTWLHDSQAFPLLPLSAQRRRGA